MNPSRPLHRASVALLLAATLTACGSGGGTSAAARPAATPSSRASVLMQEEIRRSSLSNAYDVVSTLRPRWMQTRGADSFTRPTEIQVYIDNTRLSNGLSGLRDLSSLAIVKMEWIAPIDAAARWGLDHGQGAIVVTTSSR